MADNVSVTPGSGTVIATDDVGGVQYQRVKVAKGADGKVVSDPLFAKVTASTSGNTVVVAGVTSKKVRVMAVLVSCESAVTVKFQSNTTDVTSPKYCDAKGGFAHSAEEGIFETAAGEALNINLSGAVNVGVDVAYVTE